MEIVIGSGMVNRLRKEGIRFCFHFATIYTISMHERVFNVLASEKRTENGLTLLWRHVVCVRLRIIFSLIKLLDPCFYERTRK